MRLRFSLFVTATVLLFGTSSWAQVTRIPLPPPHSEFPISAGVWVGDTLYLSGMMASTLGSPNPGDTKDQTISAIQQMQKALEAQKLSLGDVVMMHVYLAGDPAKGGKMDFAGFLAGYTQFFGTKEQPNKPARSAMQVAALAAPTGLVEIEVIAVRPK
ncbi:MAG TPA: RidA family protein [Alloacidobacterium sp.]|nr:RidA family protein [Alloacidobacterium sp.]